MGYTITALSDQMPYLYRVMLQGDAPV